MTTIRSVTLIANGTMTTIMVVMMAGVAQRGPPQVHRGIVASIHLKRKTEGRIQVQGEQHPPRWNAGAQYDPAIAWSEIPHAHHPICYAEPYRNDALHAMALLADIHSRILAKYGPFHGIHDKLTPRAYTILVPHPTKDANTATTTNQCCTPDELGGEVRGRIVYLTFSHSAWNGSPTWGLLAYPAEKFHIKNLAHEYHNLYYWLSQAQTQMRGPVDEWYREGLAEYEGMTMAVGNDAIPRLAHYVSSKLLDTIYPFGTSDRYKASNLIVAYLGQRFGEQVHAELLNHQHNSLKEALESKFAEHGTTAQREYVQLLDWIESSTA